MDTHTRLACLLVALAAPGLATAATIAVPKDQPTIQAAVDAAQSGDTIAVSKGTYAPFVVDGKSALTIKGKGKPVVDGGGAFVTVITVNASQDVTLDGLVVQNSTDRLVDVLASDDVTVRRCEFISALDGVRVRDNSATALIEKNRFTDIDNDAVDLSADGSAGPAATARVSKNQIEDVGDDAIELEGNGHVVEKNRIRDVSQSGISLDDGDSEGVTIVKNRIEDTFDTGIYVDGTAHVLEKNTLKRVGLDDQEGIQVNGSAHRIEKNKVDSPGDDGIDIEGSDCEILSNSVKKAGDSGIEVGELDSPGQASGNLFDRNKVTSADNNGVYVADTGNTFTRNKASKSGTFDLLDETVAGGNVYDKNKFPNAQIP